MVALLLQVPLELFQVFIESILATELHPVFEVVNLGGRLHSVLLVDPVYLLLLAPHQIQIVSFGLLPLPVEESLVHTVSERCLEFYVGAASERGY